MLFRLRLRHLLVNGGAGFLGAAFVRQRLKDDPELRLTVLDGRQSAAAASLAPFTDDPRLRVVPGDACDPAIVAALAAEADATINFGGSPRSAQELGTAAFMRMEIEGAYQLLEAAARARHQRFLQVSTEEVYGAVPEGRRREEDPMLPLSLFAATKGAVELLVRSYHASRGLPGMISRGPSSFGPFQDPSAIVPRLIVATLHGGEVEVEGETVREHLFVEDHVSALARVLWKGEPGAAYNVATGNELSTAELAAMVLEVCGDPSRRRVLQVRNGSRVRYAMEAKRMRPIGWEALYPLREGLRMTVDWHRRHPRWWCAERTLEPTG